MLCWRVQQHEAANDSLPTVGCPLLSTSTTSNAQPPHESHTKRTWAQPTNCWLLQDACSTADTARQQPLFLRAPLLVSLSVLCSLANQPIIVRVAASLLSLMSRNDSGVVTAAAPVATCESCSSRAGDLFCSICDRVLCLSCDAATHPASSSAPQHTRESVAAAAAFRVWCPAPHAPLYSNPAVVASARADTRLSHYCRTCRTLVCRACQQPGGAHVDSHAMRHQCVTLEEEFDTAVRGLRAIIGEEPQAAIDAKKQELRQEVSKSGSGRLRRIDSCCSPAHSTAIFSLFYFSSPVAFSFRRIGIARCDLRCHRRRRARRGRPATAAAEPGRRARFDQAAVGERTNESGPGRHRCFSQRMRH